MFTKIRPHASRRKRALPSPPSGDGMVPSASAWRHLQRTAYSACLSMSMSLSMGMMQQFSRFCPWWPWPLTFELDIQTPPRWDQTRLPCEFGANPFSGSQHIWGTNKKKQRKSQAALKTEPYLRAVITMVRSICREREKERERERCRSVL